MLAIGIPLAIQAWEGTHRWWRWGFLAFVPLIMHAVLMSYSRGAMLSIVAAVPLLVLRSSRKKQFVFVLAAFISIVPSLAGGKFGPDSSRSRTIRMTPAPIHGSTAGMR
jgi:hypothetical protein